MGEGVGDPPVLHTVGHSTRGAEEFVNLLRAHGIVLLADVRRFPGSRRHPHFGAGPLARTLEEVGIGYRHEEPLGGRRDGREDSPNGAWRNAGFRAYADHAGSEPFRRALERVLDDARSQPTAVMCAEALPWRCHRRIIADHAVVRGFRVLHLLSRDRTRTHELHPRARLREDGVLVYPPEEEDQIDLL